MIATDVLTLSVRHRHDTLARLVGDEGHFIYLAREARVDIGTAAAQAVTALKKKLGKNPNELLTAINDCADHFAREEMDQGTVLLNRVIQLLPPDRFGETPLTILHECVERLAQYQSTRPEYILLAIHVIETGWQT